MSIISEVFLQLAGGANWSEIWGKAKAKLKFIERLVNSSHTPEEFILKKKTPPSIQRARDFLVKYDLRQIIKAQRYSNKYDLFVYNNCFGFMLEVELSENMSDIFSRLFKHSYPENTTMSILLCNVQPQRKCYLILSSKEVSRKNNAKIEQQLLMSIAKQIIGSFTEYNLKAKIIKPKQYLEITNFILTGEKSNTYLPDKYIYEQLNEINSNSVGENGDILIGGISRKVFYTKQYPNVYPMNPTIYPIQIMMNDFSDIDLDYYMMLNINLNLADKEVQNYEFTSTFILHDDGNESLSNDIQSYFRRKLNWFIYPNRMFPLQQFLEIVPFQYDYSVANQQGKFSIVQKFPVDKLIQLFPYGVANDEFKS